MACSEYNPCQESTCNDCNTTNPCFDNCGCINPVDWECVNNPGTHTALSVVNTNNGATVLEKINSEIQDLQDTVGLVKLDGSDTCPQSLLSKLEAGTNISIVKTGSGCDAKLVITAGEGIGPAGVDTNVKVSASDTTTNYLNNKLVGGTYTTKTILNPAGNEQIKLDVVPSTLISIDGGNQLTLGMDGKLKTSYVSPDGSETKIAAGANIQLTGSGTIPDPYVVAVPLSVSAKRTYFDGVWKTLTFNNGGNPNVTLVSQSVKYRLRFDGTIEYRGNLTYTINFTTNKIVINNSSVPTGGLTNLASIELDRSVELKNMMTFDTPTTINITPNLWGYTIRQLAGGNINMDLMSSTSGSKTLVITFDGCQYHPNI